MPIYQLKKILFILKIQFNKSKKYVARFEWNFLHLIDNSVIFPSLRISKSNLLNRS